jgi:hypothetical protein
MLSGNYFLKSDELMQLKMEKGERGVVCRGWGGEGGQTDLHGAEP